MNTIIYWSPGVKLDDIERQVIQKAYQHFQRNASQTAIALGINEKTVRMKLEKYESEAKDAADRQQQARDRQLEFQRRARGPRRDSSGAVILESGRDDITLERGAKRVDQGSEGAEDPRPNGVHAQQRVRMEPADEAPAKHAVSVQEREKVQAVSSKNFASNRKHANR